MMIRRLQHHMHIIPLTSLLFILFVHICILMTATESKTYTTIDSKFGYGGIIDATESGDNSLTVVVIGDWGIGGKSGSYMSAIDGKFNTDFIGEEAKHLQYDSSPPAPPASTTISTTATTSIPSSTVSSPSPAAESTSDATIGIDAVSPPKTSATLFGEFVQNFNSGLKKESGVVYLNLKSKKTANQHPDVGNEASSCARAISNKRRLRVRNNYLSGSATLVAYKALKSVFQLNAPGFLSRIVKIAFNSESSLSDTTIKSDAETAGARVKRELGGSTYQWKTAQTMGTYAADMNVKPSFVLSLGDNFYKSGLKDYADALWDYLWKEIYIDNYSALGIYWFPVVGNHDLYAYSYGNYNAYAQLQRTLKYPTGYWQMPDYNYTKKFVIPAGKNGGTAGILQIIFVDTTTLCPFVNKYTNSNSGVSSDTQASRYNNQMEYITSYLEETENEKPTWLLFAGHYPTFSTGDNGGNSCLYNALGSLFRQYNVHACFSGHDHAAQHLRYDGVEYFVSGHGAIMGNVGKTSTAANYLWGYASTTSFATIEATTSYMNVKYIDISGNVIYSYQLTNPNPDFMDPYATDANGTNDDVSEPTSQPTTYKPTGQPSGEPTMPGDMTYVRIQEYANSQKNNIVIIMMGFLFFIGGYSFCWKRQRHRSDDGGDDVMKIKTINLRSRNSSFLPHATRSISTLSRSSNMSTIPSSDETQTSSTEYSSETQSDYASSAFASESTSASENSYTEITATDSDTYYSSEVSSFIQSKSNSNNSKI